MTKEEKGKYLPMSTAGILGSSTESESKIALKPHHILIGISVLIVIEILLPFMG